MKRKPKAAPPEPPKDYKAMYEQLAREIEACQLYLIGTLKVLGRPVTVPVPILAGIKPGEDFYVATRDTNAAGDFVIMHYHHVVPSKDGSKGPKADPGSKNGSPRPSTS